MTETLEIWLDRKKWITAYLINIEMGRFNDMETIELNLRADLSTCEQEIGVINIQNQVNGTNSISND